MWKPHGNKKKKQKKKQREAEVEQELSGEVAGGGRSSSIHAALEQLGQYPARGDDSLCRNGTWYSVRYRQELWEVCIQIPFGRTTATPLGSENFTLEILSSLLLLLWHCQFARSCFVCLKSWDSIATVVSSAGAAAAAGRGRTVIRLLVGDWIREEGETGMRNISLTVLVWKLNGFWEFKLDAIFFSPVRECGVLDLPLERRDC